MRGSPNVLVTGGAGFIGSHLVEALVHRGYAVTVLDNLENGSRGNLARLPNSTFKLVLGDVCDPKVLAKVMKKMEIVFHLAALPSVQHSIHAADKARPVNFEAGTTVLKAAVQHGLRRFVFASSAAVYGNTEVVPVPEDADLDPQSPYALHKLAVEGYALSARAQYGIQTCCLRFFNAYGPRQRADSPYSGVISIFHDRLLRGERPVIFGDGTQTRDFVSVLDVVQAVILGAESPEADGGIFNVGTGIGSSLLELLRVMNRVLDTDLQPEFRPPRSGDILHSVADISRIRGIGFAPKYNLEQGIRYMVESADLT